MKRLLTISAIVLTTFTAKLSAQAINIPDPIFKAFLVGNAAINTSGNGEIEVAEANAYTGGIFAGTLGCSDITGIEYFTQLTILDISQNSIASVDLSYNTALTSFNCQFCGLTCLDLSNNPNLTSVDCGSNNLTKLNLKNGNNAILTSMDCTGNPVALSCIQVDNAAAATAAPGWAEDTWSFYNTVCTQPIANFTTNAPVCFGTAINFTETAVNETSWCWDFGDGDTSTFPNPAHTFLGTGDYNVQLVAKNCYGKDTIVQVVTQGKSIYGVASYTGGPINGGTAVLHPYFGTYQSFDTVQVVPVDNLGNFFFGHVQDGQYLVKIFPDAVNNPTLISTYYIGHWAWDSSTVVTHGCTTDAVTNVFMVEAAGTAGGPGVAHGIVQQGFGFGRANGDPVHGVDVKLGLTGTNTIVAQTTTDLNGEYQFINLALGDYSIFVDIPGLERDSVYEISITAVDSQFLDLNYLVDSVAIYVLPNIGIEEVDADDPNFKIYPNPMTDNATIAYTINSNANVNLDIYNIYGMKVMTLVSASQSPGDYIYNFTPTTNKLNSGIYFLTLTGDGKTKVKRIIVTN